MAMKSLEGCAALVLETTSIHRVFLLIQMIEGFQGDTDADTVAPAAEQPTRIQITSNNYIQ